MNDRASKHLCVWAAACGTMLAISVATAPAWAQPSHDFVVTGEPVPTRVVRVADLNLATDAGLTTLNWRVRGAVRSLCGKPTLVLQHNQWVRGCTRTANESANEQITALRDSARYADRKAAVTSIQIAARR